MSGAKSWDLKLRTYALWTPHKEHTKSVIRKDRLAPCRFNCWMNQISIGISQPLAQLQRLYNVEIPLVSLHVGQAKWDFRTDRFCILQHIIWHILHIWNPVHLDRIGQIGTYWYVPVRTGTTQYKTVRESHGRTYWYVLVHISTYSQEDKLFSTHPERVRRDKIKPVQLLCMGYNVTKSNFKSAQV